MKKIQVSIGLLILIGALGLGGSSLAAATPTIERYVFGSAGGELKDDGNLYVLNGTLGEPIAADFVQGSSHGLSSGYWAGGAIVNRGGIVYLPLVVK